MLSPIIRHFQIFFYYKIFSCIIFYHKARQSSLHFIMHVYAHMDMRIYVYVYVYAYMHVYSYAYVLLITFFMDSYRFMLLWILVRHARLSVPQAWESANRFWAGISRWTAWQIRMVPGIKIQKCVLNTCTYMRIYEHVFTYKYTCAFRYLYPIL